MDIQSSTSEQDGPIYIYIDYLQGVHLIEAPICSINEVDVLSSTSQSSWETIDRPHPVLLHQNATFRSSTAKLLRAEPTIAQFNAKSGVNVRCTDRGNMRYCVADIYDFAYDVWPSWDGTVMCDKEVRAKLRLTQILGSYCWVCIVLAWSPFRDLFDTSESECFTCSYTSEFVFNHCCHSLPSAFSPLGDILYKIKTHAPGIEVLAKFSALFTLLSLQTFDFL